MLNEIFTCLVLIGIFMVLNIWQVGNLIKVIENLHKYLIIKNHLED